jgi:hypothetical protein
MGISGSSVRYQPAPDRNAHFKMRLHEVARPGVGYRCAWAVLHKEFAPLNPKRVHPLWKELRLSVRPKTRKRKFRTPMPDAPSAPGQLWSLDFVHDACLNGTKLKILTVIDEFTRECLALEAHTSIKAAKVRSILSSLFTTHGQPKYLRSDNGPELVAHSLAIWLAVSGTKAGSLSLALLGKTESSKASTENSETSSLMQKCFITLPRRKSNSGCFSVSITKNDPIREPEIFPRTICQTIRKPRSNPPTTQRRTHLKVTSQRGQTKASYLTYHTTPLATQ